MVCSPHQYILQGMAQSMPAYVPQQFQPAQMYQAAAQQTYRGTELPSQTYRATQYTASLAATLPTQTLYQPVVQTQSWWKPMSTPQEATMPEMLLGNTATVQDYGVPLYVPPSKEIRDQQRRKSNRETLLQMIQQELRQVEPVKIGGQLCAA